MKTYTITFEDRQGVLLRILTAVTRRGIPLQHIFSKPGQVQLNLDVSEKHEAQLLRDWRSTIDVLEAR